MKNKILKAFLKGMAGILCGIVLASMNPMQVYAYTYAKTGASEKGTATIEEIPDNNIVNGYGRVGAYRVTYTIEQDQWTAFEDRNGGYFLVANQLDAAGGCHFAYHYSGGQVWQDGAIALGLFSDGMVAAISNVSSGRVSHSIDFPALDQIPQYIGYAYEPSSSAYLHINDDKGYIGHVWYYADLKKVSVQSSSSVDMEAPSLNVSVVPKGTTAKVGGKVWSTAADITVTANDDKARPEGIRIYNEGSLLKEIKNENNETVIQGSYEVTQNGVYRADAYDKLNNAGKITNVIVSCIDREAPVIASVTPDTTAYAREVTLKASASDDGCGLHDKAYSWNGAAFSSQAQLKVTENGTYTLRVRDALGNESVKSVTVSNIDKNAPEVSHKLTRTGMQTTYQGVLWSTGAELSAEASDKESGMACLKLVEESGKVLVEEKGAAGKKTLFMEGRQVERGNYGFLAEDNLGNAIQTEWIRVLHVDSEAPIIHEINTEKTRDGLVRIMVSANDAPGGIGLEEKAYSFDGGETWQEENAYTVEENGTYEIVVRDRLGQKGMEICQVTEVSPKEKEEEKMPGGDEKPPVSDESDGSDQPDIPDHPDSSEKPDGAGDVDGSGETDGSNKTNQPSTPGSSQGQGSLQSPSILPETGHTSKSAKSKKAVDTTEKSSVSENSSSHVSPKVWVEREEVFLEDALNEAKEEVISEVSPPQDLQGKKQEKSDPVKTAVTAVLGMLFGLGCLGLILYLLLFYLQHSCILYEVDDEQKRKRLCRLLVHKEDGNWLIKVPEHRLGLSGTGNYLLVFHSVFLKEDEPDAVIIEIDGVTLRERPAKEVSFSI